MSYQVPNHIDKDKIFIINRSEIDGRLDAQFYKSYFTIPESIRLSSFAKVLGGKRIPKGKSFSDVDTPYLYLRVADIDPDSDINYGTIKCIEKEVFDILKRYEIKEQELAISIAGTVGKVSLIKDIPIGKSIILTENCAKIVIKEGARIKAEYLRVLFTMPFIQKQLERYYIQTTIPKLGIDKILKLKFPTIPSFDFQNSIIQLVQASISAKKEKALEAQNLLDNIDEYLLEMLGIELPEINTDLASRIFFTSFNQIADRRFDPAYTVCWGKNAKSTKYENISLRSVANICKGDALTSDEVRPGNIPVIAGGQTSPYSHSEANFKGNVITVSASGAHAGFVWYHNTPIFATDCCVIRSKDEASFLTEYIFEVLKVQQKSIYWLQTGAAQPHVYASDLELLSIPVIPLKLQQEIVNHISNIRKKADALIDEGDSIMSDSIRKIEQMILNNRAE